MIKKKKQILDIAFTVLIFALSFDYFSSFVSDDLHKNPLTVTSRWRKGVLFNYSASFQANGRRSFIPTFITLFSSSFKITFISGA